MKCPRDCSIRREAGLRHVTKGLAGEERHRKKPETHGWGGAPRQEGRGAMETTGRPLPGAGRPVQVLQEAAERTEERALTVAARTC